MFMASASVVILALLLGLMQAFGETRLSWIFPIISVVAVLAFLARCMFVAPTHH
jgi:hypothetical protein